MRTIQNLKEDLTRLWDQDQTDHGELNRLKEEAESLNELKTLKDHLNYLLDRDLKSLTKGIP